MNIIDFENINVGYDEKIILKDKPNLKDKNEFLYSFSTISNFNEFFMTLIDFRKLKIDKLKQKIILF